ncbi:MAG TPA: hypothetical protein VEG35_03410 [Burkholderiales bacterium]|nr:hypothetical protein [Burkholderiales bacterium]
MGPRVPRLAGRIVVFCLGLAGLIAAAAAEEFSLDNGRLRAEFNDRGLVALSDIRSGRRVALSADPTSVTIGDEKICVAELGPAEVETKPAKLTFRYIRDPYTFDVSYELRPGWAFLSKQIVVTSAGRSAFRVKEVALLDTKLDQAVLDELKLADGRWGSFCRFGAPGAAAGPPAWGLFFAVQNPFLAWKRDGQSVSASYAPDMEWKPDYGPFASDRLCIGLYGLSGVHFPAKAVPEWKLVADYSRLLTEVPTIDATEVAALSECVKAFLLYFPGRTRVHVPWCENDYQVDVGTPEGVAEYKRIMDRAAELGANYLLYTPANRELSRLEDNADAWGWENILWFGLGQKIRKGEWDPETDDVPAGLRPMLDYAASKNLKLMAYAYPSLPFLQNPEWTRWAGDKVGGYSGADTGLRSYQDWWIAKLLAFVRRTGAAGFSFDHWWIAYDNASSKYAQWYGCRRILETLRREVPDIVIDGRQQYQNFGPWTWLAGSYPHPTLTDEQPESFTAFPDLHTDRVSADRQRFAAWTYRVERFAPPEITPGFMTHQSERSDEKDVMRRDQFRPRDWDALGWKYSVLSSIGTAPFNHVLNFIPARDPEEFKALSDDDKAWLRRWLDWTEANAKYLHALRPIIGPPMLGRADGTAAVVEDRGFVFLFNPNPGRVEARLRLDASIGLVKGERFVLREALPEEGKVLGSPEGFFRAGDEVSVPLSGADARVYEVFPAPEKVEEPVLFNASGGVELSGGRLALTGVSGEPGTSAEALVLLPAGKVVRSLSVNGAAYPFKQKGDLVPVTVRFVGKPFGRLERLGVYDPNFTGGTFRAKFTVPARVFKQLADRKEKWPVTYTEDDLRAPWLGSWRLLLFAAVAEPDESMDITAKVNGQPVPVKKAYNSVYPHSPKRTYLGSYLDLSGLRPDTPYEIEMTLPPLPAGRLLGLFFENIEPESTERILAPKPLTR